MHQTTEIFIHRPRTTLATAVIVGAAVALAVILAVGVTGVVLDHPTLARDIWPDTPNPPRAID